MDPVEIQRIIEQAADEMRQFGAVSRSTSEALRDAQTGIAGYTQKQREANRALGKSALDLADSFSKGKKDFSAFNDLIGQSANALNLLILSLGPMGLAAKAATVAITTLAVGASKLNEFNQQLLEAFQSLATTGSVTAGGVDELLKSIHQAGFTLQEFNEYAGLIKANTENFALFARSVANGRKAFSEIYDAMDPFRVELLNQGITLQDQREGTLSYIKLQGQIGRAQRRQNETQEQFLLRLAAGSRGYLTEMEALTRATGVQRRDAEAEIDRARNEERFRAKLEAMRASGDQQQIEAAKQLEIANAVLAKQAPETAQGFRDIASGIISSEAAGKFFMATSGRAGQVMNNLTSGGADAAQTLQALYPLLSGTAKQFNQLAQIGAYGDAFGNFAEHANLGVRALDNLPENLKRAQVELAEMAGAQNKQTQDLNQAFMNMLKTNQEAQKTMQIGAPAAASALEKLTSAALTAAQALNKLGGKQDTKIQGPETAVSQKAEQDYRKQQQITLADQKKQIEATNAVKKAEEDRKKLIISGNASEAELKAAKDKIVEAKKQEAEQTQKANRAWQEEQAKRTQLEAERRKAARVEGQIKAKESEIIKQSNNIESMKQEADKLRVKEQDARDKENAYVANRFKAQRESLQKDVEKAEIKLKKETAELAEMRGKLISPTQQTGASMDDAEARRNLRGAAAKNLNPGNLAFAGQAGARPSATSFADQAKKIPFAEFESLSAGTVALAQQVEKFIGSGQYNTVSAMIERYAPRSDKRNNTDDYINKLSAYLGVGMNQPLDRNPKTIAKLMAGIIGIENYGDPFKGIMFRQQIIGAVTQALKVDASQLEGFRRGGIAEGPNSGYTTTLHGTEAVVPLDSSRSIPVDLNTNLAGQFSNFNSKLDSMVTALNVGLQELIYETKRNGDTASRLLQVTQN